MDDMNAITEEYRQEVCIISSKASKKNLTAKGRTNNEKHISEVVAQDVRSRLHLALLAVNSSNKEEPMVCPCCLQCGAPLQPGLAGTSVRLQAAPKPSRNQRRRQAAYRERVKRNPSTKTTRLEEFCNNPQKVPIHVRNYQVITCGTCKATSFAPGLPRRKPSAPTAKRKNPTKPPPRPKQDLSPSSDFVSFGDDHSSKKKKSRMTLDQSGKKKKMKKTQLMNFLSSLND